MARNIVRKYFYRSVTLFVYTMSHVSGLFQVGNILLRKGDFRMRYYALLLGILIFSCASFAQEVTAGVYGTVLDTSASAVPRATITLRNLETGRTMQTHSDDSGNFVLTLVPIGSYDVTAESAGFRTNRVTGVVLRVNDNRRINFTVEVGAVTEQVNVEAELVSVNTASGATSAVLEGREMLKMP